MNVCGEDQPATSQTAWRATPDIRALEAAISESALIVKERQAGSECLQGKHIAVLTALEQWPCMLLSQTGNTKNVCISTC